MRSNIEEQILLYSQLSADERLAVDVYVGIRPELAPLLAEAKALDVLLAEAHVLEEEPPRDEALAYFVATRYLAEHAPPEALGEVFERLEARIERDPDLRARVEAYDARLRELEETAAPAAQFERLSGYRLAPDPPPRASRRPLVSRFARTGPSMLRRVLVTAGGVLVGLLALYGLLLLAGRTAMSDVERLAVIERSSLELEGFGDALRSSAQVNGDSAADALYLRALARLREARTSTLGLFPAYDYEKLAEAEALLEQVVTREADSARAFLPLEAYFFLGKIRLAQGQVPEAADAFQQVVDGRGRNAGEAAEILQVLQRHLPTVSPGSPESPI